MPSASGPRSSTSALLERPARPASVILLCMLLRCGCALISALTIAAFADKGSFAAAAATSENSDGLGVGLRIDAPLSGTPSWFSDSGTPAGMRLVVALNGTVVVDEEITGLGTNGLPHIANGSYDLTMCDDALLRVTLTDLADSTRQSVSTRLFRDPCRDRFDVSVPDFIRRGASPRVSLDDTWDRKSNLSRVCFRPPATKQVCMPPRTAEKVRARGPKARKTGTYTVVWYTLDGLRRATFPVRGPRRSRPETPPATPLQPITITQIRAEATNQALARLGSDGDRYSWDVAGCRTTGRLSGQCTVVYSGEGRSCSYTVVVYKGRNGISGGRIVASERCS